MSSVFDYAGRQANRLRTEWKNEQCNTARNSGLLVGFLAALLLFALWYNCSSNRNTAAAAATNAQVVRALPHGSRRARIGSHGFRRTRQGEIVDAATGLPVTNGELAALTGGLPADVTSSALLNNGNNVVLSDNNTLPLAQAPVLDNNNVATDFVSAETAAPPTVEALGTPVVGVLPNDVAVQVTDTAAAPVAGNGSNVQVDTFGENALAWHPEVGQVSQGKVQEYDTTVSRPEVVAHKAPDQEVTRYKTETVPVNHPAVPYSETEMVPVTVTVPQPDKTMVGYKDVPISVSTPPFSKTVKQPYVYSVPQPPIQRVEYRPVPKVHPSVPYTEVETRPVSFTVQPPDFVTTEYKKIPVVHPGKKWYTTETVLKPVTIKVPHVTPGYTTTRLEGVKRIHHQAPITATKAEQFKVTKYRPAYVTMGQQAYTETIPVPPLQRIGYKDAVETFQPPAHTEIQKQPYTYNVPQGALTETKTVPVVEQKWKPAYTTYSTKQTPYQQLIPGKTYETIELKEEKIHHKVFDQAQEIAATTPFKTVGYTSGQVPAVVEKDHVEYATACSSDAQCGAGVRCGTQFSSAAGGLVRVCCTRGVDAQGNCLSNQD